ncbi:ShlB/FhaC/HecB family hemolysin secretion/activation protein [Polaromonas sp.]|uniref:ShlB/FhaC/HecB family hemolysin secretion/activation protein n=1 Tax=Polaromonas sp. TaxID=1869339 RepID=UPI0025CD69E6|nr:ShlB/FhaC/HecB family hemolysin secretion/activation protein [Polaromonas sp.]
MDAAQEQRRAQEREKALREQLEATPDVRLRGEPESGQARLPASETPCFEIRSITLRGEGTAPQQFDWLLGTLAGPATDDSPLGRCMGAQGIQLVLKRAQDALVARGFVTSRVLAEPQDLKSGSLALTVLPGSIRAIRSAPGSNANPVPRNTAPVEPGTVLNLRDVEQTLENLKRVPTAEADIQIEPAELPGQSDLVVSYKQAFPLRLSLSADDSGSKGTGKYQGGLALSWDNPLGLNDLFYVSFNGDLGGGDAGDRGTRGRTLHYSVPMGYWLLGATASKSRYWQSVAGLSQSYVYRGTSHNAELKLSRLVYRDAVRKTTLSMGAFYRSSNNYIDDTEIEVQRRKVGGWQAALHHREFIGQSTLDTTLAYKRGTGAFHALPAPEEAFGEGTSRFKLVTLDVALAAPFQLAQQKFRYNASVRAQANRSPLSPQDRFAIGGRYTVRGFDGNSSLVAERGWLLRNDLGVALGNSGQELYAGLDHGEVSGPLAEFLSSRRLTGAVLGLRGSFKALTYDLFAGRPLEKPQGFVTARNTVGVSLNYSF